MKGKSKGHQVFYYRHNDEWRGDLVCVGNRRIEGGGGGVVGQRERERESKVAHAGTPR